MGRGKEVNKVEKFWLLIGQASMFSEANFFFTFSCFWGQEIEQFLHLELPKAVI